MLHSSVFHTPRFIRSLLLPRSNRFFSTLTPTTLLVVWLLAFTSVSASLAPVDPERPLTIQLPSALFAPAAITLTPSFDVRRSFGTGTDATSSVAVGDMDGDSD